MTAQVHLSAIWLNSAADPSDYLFLPLTQSWQVSESESVSFDVCADGATRGVTTPGRQKQGALTVKAVEPDQRAWIEAHAATLIWARDDRQRKFSGVYTSPQIVEHPYDGNCDVSLTVNEITHEEASAA